jgi:N-methylhydantoinase B/oxoprolinase/acetone carboxylase alpha subunit
VTGEVTLDPAALQVLIARLTGIATEMGAVLARSAFSPNIKERHDHSAALFTPEGEMLVQAEHIPVHLGSMPASVAAVIERFGPGTDGWERVASGEQIILNDPFAGGTHLNDITLVAACVVGGRLVGWVANRAHHADVGGAAPGSMPADAVEIYAEGLRLPPVVLTGEVRELLCANSRTPDERLGDLDAQVGANRRGVDRLAALAEAPLDEVLAHGERRMRAALAALPDGVWRFADVVDSFGPRPEQQVETHVRVEVRVEGDTLTFDLSACDPQRAGNVNAVRAVTVSAAVYALRCALDPDLPANGGALRPVTVLTAPGTIVDALPPAAVGAGNVEVSQRVADLCLGALAQVVPGQLGAASQGTMNNLLMGGTDAAGRPWVYYETVAGGQGGRVQGPGMSGVHTAMTNTRNTPVEALERAFPLRVRKLELRRGSGGAGTHAGGEGIEREVELLADATVSLITERRRSAPWGTEGGEPAAPGENWLLPGGREDDAVALPDKVTVDAKAGDVIRLRTPGGGGWGAPDGPSG